MNLQQFYAMINGDYTDVLSRFGNDARIIKFIRLFPSDTSYHQFIAAIAINNSEDAFRAIHTLKGIILNLGFTGMYPLVNDVTEQLRHGTCDQALPYLPQLESAFNLHLNAIEQLLHGDNA